MSKVSWIGEYYPVKADKESKENAINHSLNKWIGLLPENLKKHDLDSPPISIDASTCALCYHYFDETKGDCINCPLCITRENTPCDSHNGNIDKDIDPCFSYRSDNKDPQPMIYWLTKTKEDNY